MQAEDTDQEPKFSPLKTDGVRPQTESHLITDVLLSGEWFPIVPGTFHYYVTTSDRPVPYIQFQAPNEPAFGSLAGKTIEAFPQTVGAYAYIDEA